MKANTISPRCLIVLCPLIISSHNGCWATTRNLMEANIALSFYNEDFENKNEHDRNNIGNHNVRFLQDGGRLTARSFPECREQNLSPEECQDWIETQIEAAGGHEVGNDVIVKIRNPRTPEQFEESYWMVEVPVNIYDVVACDRNNGYTYYPFDWKDGTTNEVFKVEDQNCYGLTGAECCLHLRNYGKQLTVSGYDEHNQCLSCFIHREPLEPIKDTDSDDILFLDNHIGDNGETCTLEEFTANDVDAQDETTVAQIDTAITALETFDTDRSCENFDLLLEKLYRAASMIPPLSMKIGRLACSVCYGTNDLDLNDPFVANLIEEILTLLQQNTPSLRKSSKEKCIIIHTNSNGDEVVLDPTFGSALSDLVPVAAPTSSPVKLPNGTCLDDPLACAEDEYCGQEYYPDDDKFFGLYRCIQNTCVQEPSICKEDEFCEVLDFDWGRCEPNTCLQDPSICKEGEYCSVFSEVSTTGTCYTITCAEDPTICSDTEWCDDKNYNEREALCLENRCLTNPPEDCQAELGKTCIPQNPRFSNTRLREVASDYICQGRSCEDDSICEEGESCRYFYGEVPEFQCQPTTCIEDPTLCTEETDFCDLFYEKCDYNPCLFSTKPCPEEFQICIPISNAYYNPYDCKDPACDYDPTLCSENEDCVEVENNPDVTHECVPKSETGEN